MDSRKIAEQLKAFDSRMKVHVNPENGTVIGTTPSLEFADDATVKTFAKIITGKQTMITRSGAKVRIAIS